MLHSNYRLEEKSASKCHCEHYLFTTRFIQRILSSVFCGSLLVDGIDTQLTEGRRSQQNNQRPERLITVRPANSKPSICSKAILASSALLYLSGNEYRIPKEIIIMTNVLNERIAFASSSYRIFMKVDKFQLSEGFKNLLDVAFREVEVERTNIKSGESQN
jgi:hypothetical protein